MTLDHHLVPRYEQPGQDTNKISFPLEATEEQYVRMTNTPIIRTPTSTFYTLTKGQHETVPHFLSVAYNGTVVYDPSSNVDNVTVDGNKYFEVRVDSIQANGTVVQAFTKLYVSIHADTTEPSDPDDHPSSGTDQGTLDTRPATNNTVGVSVYPGYHIGDELFSLSGRINTTDDEAKAFSLAYANAIEMHPNSHKPSAAPTTKPLKTSELLNADKVETVYTTTANASLYHLDHSNGILTFIGDFSELPIDGTTVTVESRDIYSNADSVYTVTNSAEVTVKRLLNENTGASDAKEHAKNFVTRSSTTHQSHLPWWMLLIIALGVIMFVVLNAYLWTKRK